MAHGVAYRIVVPDGLERRQLLEATGHSYLDPAPVFSLCLTLVALGLVACLLSRDAKGPVWNPPPWLVASLPLLGFAAREGATNVLRHSGARRCEILVQRVGDTAELELRVASVDELGQWFLHGRSDDTIKVAGKRLGPAEVETVLVSHDAVVEAAAVGIPDEVKGEALVGLIENVGHHGNRDLFANVSRGKGERVVISGEVLRRCRAIRRRCVVDRYLTCTVMREADRERSRRRDGCRRDAGSRRSSLASRCTRSSRSRCASAGGGAAALPGRTHPR